MEHATQSLKIDSLPAHVHALEFPVNSSRFQTSNNNISILEMSQFFKVDTKRTLKVDAFGVNVYFRKR